MGKGYFSLAWNDLVNSPGWFSKIVCLGLILCIPIYGFVVAMGYLFGWARDIAWNVHRPLPQRIYGNEDGFLYRRGLVLLAIMLIFAAAVYLIDVCFMLLGNIGFIQMFLFGTSTVPELSVLSLFFNGTVAVIILIAISIVIQIVYWVAFMRSSIYGTVYAGCQLGKIWTMIKADFGGLMRILGMKILLGIAESIVIFFAAIMVIVMAGTIMSLNIWSGSAPLIALFGLLILAIMLLMVVLVSCAEVFTQALIARALGYWTSQFNVPEWGNQTDPLPMERTAAS